MSEYSRVVCRGSFALGSACGKCERCAEQLQARCAELERKLELAKLASEFDKAPDNYGWEDEHPIFKMAADIDRLESEKAQQHELIKAVKELLEFSGKGMTRTARGITRGFLITRVQELIDQSAPHSAERTIIGVDMASGKDYSVEIEYPAESENSNE